MTIRTGEIVAYRVWRLTLRGGGWRLRSLTQSYVYGTEPFNGGLPGKSEKSGVFALKSARQADELLTDALIAVPILLITLWAVLPAVTYGLLLINGMPLGIMLIPVGACSMATIFFTGVLLAPRVVGRVEIWGEVVEHERGYRAEYARVVAIDRVYSPLGGRKYLLRRLRETYRC